MMRFLGLVLGVVLAFPQPTWAQWSNHAEKNLPRTADGKLKFDAPTPRMPNGKPDLSGLWRDTYELAGNLGKDSPGGAPLQPWARELVEKRIARQGVDDPSSFCLPTGLVGLNMFSIFRILYHPDRMVQLFELTTTYRQIFLDGRALPEDPQPSYMGYSVARWEGDTLVVESTGFNGKSWIDAEGRPITEKLRLTERFSRPSFGRLEIAMTFDDPGAYTKPWTARVEFDYQPDSELTESYCEDNKFDEQLDDAGVEHDESTPGRGKPAQP